MHIRSPADRNKLTAAAFWRLMQFEADLMPEGPLCSDSAGMRREMPVIAAVPAHAGRQPSPDLAPQLRGIQQLAWERGERLPVEQLLARYPAIAADAESVIDLIYHEYLLHEQFGDRPEPGAFVARFPEHAAALRLQIAFHLAVAEAPPDQFPSPAAG